MTVFYKRWLTPLVLLWALTGVTASADEKNLSTEYQQLKLVKVAGGLSNPWAVAFLPEGRYLVSERANGLFILDGDKKTQVNNLPEFYATRQGGLLDVVLDPDYENNGWLYLTYSKGNSEATTPALVRARLDGDALTHVEQLFESNEYTGPGRHYGSRILFLKDGTLLMTIGDRGAEPPRAQDTMDHSGSVVRLNRDGSIPKDNPFVEQEGYKPEIYSYGHRNIQGIVQAANGEIWATEHGPRGGDELNLIQPGKNFGWPTATLGRDYGTEGPFPDAETRQKSSMVDPVFEFLPTLAPSGLTVVTSEHFPNWQGNLLAGGLRSERVLRLVIEEQTVIHAEELLLKEIGRIRDLRQGPDGFIYVLTDQSDGGLYRLEPRR